MDLWNAAGDDPPGGRDPAILEQYKLYVEMADRVSQRRGLANTFFLTLNTGVFTVIAASWGQGSAPGGWWLAPPLAAALGQCVAWRAIVRSYGQLSAAKFRVIGELETVLPASPFVRAEWTELGEGRDRRLYRPLHRLEGAIPLWFGLTYVAAFVTAFAG